MIPNIEKKGKPPVEEEQLDLLALFFTLVKVLFIGGALQVVEQLVRVIEPVREGWEFHLTTIRNEHAYYCCIAQLMHFHSLPLPFHLKPIYVAGDSHSLAPSWHTVKFRGEERLLVPKLVTGLKIWHLREESVFFPKRNFWNVIDTIPPYSDVILLFGEIDCREGLVSSLHKCRYDSLEEAVEFLVQLYCPIVRELIEKRKLNIIMHPIVPVLDPTRPFVKALNQQMKKTFSKWKEVLWMDFFEDLLLPGDPTAFDKERYDLDGTHLSPKYLSLVERELNKK